ncbi:MAG: AmmeMemoRadiSam system protein B [Patescibacteria group bacterium]
MSLTFACISPHTPLLMPTIGKENLKALEKTRKSMEQLEQELYVSQPETIIVVSPHGDSLADALSINFTPKYRTNFEEFGDLTTKLEWRADTQLIDRIREDFKNKHLPLSLTSSENLDYGSAVPLFYLTQHLPKVQIIPILTAGLDTKTHYNFGRELKDEIMSSTKRVAVIASADLSHRAGENSPEGMSPRGVAFDEKIQEIVSKKNPLGIIDIDDAWADEAQACGAKVIALLCGILDEVHFEPLVLSYEKPVGVGHMVAQMKIS